MMGKVYNHIPPPRKLNDHIIDEICRGIAIGLRPSRALEAIGINGRTAHEWDTIATMLINDGYNIDIDTGNQTVYIYNDVLPIDSDDYESIRVYLRLAASIKRAEADHIQSSLVDWQRFATDRKSWEGIATLLDRRYHDYTQRPTVQDVSSQIKALTDLVAELKRPAIEDKPTVLIGQPGQPGDEYVNELAN